MDEIELARIANEERELRKETSRLASMANKRIKRLEESGLKSPALKSWEEGGAVRFSVSGKSYWEVQQEYWRLKNFLDNKTSTVKGTKDFINEMATGIGLYPVDKETRNTEELIHIQEQATQFFEIASKVKQYLENTDRAAVALDYQKIWEKVSEYVTTEKIDLAETELDVEQINQIIDSLMALEDEEEYWRIIREIERNS